MSANASIGPGLRLFTSNRLETLAGKLAGALRPPPASPLEPAIIVVRNKGMERWLKLELAVRLGIAANQRFPFPEAFAVELFRAAFPDLPDDAPIDREILSWRIARVLHDLSNQPGFEDIARYLDGPGHQPGERDDRNRLQLSRRLAHQFDQYLIFRPELVLAWDRGSGSDWQARLWQAISEDIRHSHAAALRQRFHDVLAAGNLTLEGLPARISLFGISALPPFYLELFASLARQRQVNLFLLQPSQEYWGDITSAREEGRILRRRSLIDEGPFQAHLDPGNRLLSSLGYLGRDFLKLILDAGDWVSDEDFADPGEDSLLHCIQSDILHLRDRGRQDNCPRRVIRADDDSIRVHSCHSPLREMEVLHDRLLDWFEHDSTLAPRDVVVMTPDIEVYAPFIQAVFGAPEDPERAIPFSLADRSARRESHVVETFLRILHLPETRLGAATVLELLETEAVRARFGLQEADLERLRAWVELVRIRWGRDAQHRAAIGLPALPDHTWQAGLDRLWLGYSMAGDDLTLFNGTLPSDGIEGDDAELFGHFTDFTERVFETTARLESARTLDAWAETLETILGVFFEPTDATAHELQIVRDALDQLRRGGRVSVFDEQLDRAALLEALRPALEEDRFGSGFLTGGVTFCGLKPMRSIPFRIVCLVGMNDGAFPRTPQHLGFDLMAKAPRLGDRSTREDDRYLFLETLLSARERLHLSHVGQSVRNNKETPPSVLVSELLDYAEQGFALTADDNGGELRRQLIVRHRLQAFSEEYFRGDSRLFSYSQENCRASAMSREARTAVPSFVPAPLSTLAPESGHVTLGELTAFLRNPAKFFLTRRLEVHLPKDYSQVEEREDFVLDALDGTLLKQELLDRLCARERVEDAGTIVRASGRLPAGPAGEAEFRHAKARAERLHERLTRERLLDWIEPLDVDIRLEPFMVRGRITPRTEAGPLLYRCAKLKAKDVLQAWVRHLAANVVTPGSVTTLIAEDQLRRFAPPPDAVAELRALLAMRERGLSGALKFFPVSAMALVEAEAASKPGRKPAGNAKTPMQIATEAWEGNDFLPWAGERHDPYVERCFGHETLDEEFQAIARSVFEPILRVQTREKW